MHDSDSHATTSKQRAGKRANGVRPCHGRAALQYIHVNITRFVVWRKCLCRSQCHSLTRRSTRRHSSAQSQSWIIRTPDIVHPLERAVGVTGHAMLLSARTPGSMGFFVQSRAPCRDRHVWPAGRRRRAHAKRVGRRIAYSSTNSRASGEGATGSTKHRLPSPTQHASLRLERQKAG